MQHTIGVDNQAVGPGREREHGRLLEQESGAHHDGARVVVEHLCVQRRAHLARLIREQRRVILAAAAVDLDRLDEHAEQLGPRRHARWH